MCTHTHTHRIVYGCMYECDVRVVRFVFILYYSHITPSYIRLFFCTHTLFCDSKVSLELKWIPVFFAIRVFLWYFLTFVKQHTHDTTTLKVKRGIHDHGLDQNSVVLCSLVVRASNWMNVDERKHIFLSFFLIFPQREHYYVITVITHKRCYLGDQNALFLPVLVLKFNRFIVAVNKTIIIVTVLNHCMLLEVLIKRITCNDIHHDVR